MNPFEREPEPGFWAERERRFLKASCSAEEALHGWQHQKKKLSHWFHQCVRPAGHPDLCAYCDGQLEETSPKTIDHFVPESLDRGYGLAWLNLFPACVNCNSTFKGTQYSCYLVRPDRDPVDQWFAFDPSDGRLYPAPELERKTRARVRLTIRIFGLNHSTRCSARVRTWKTLENIVKEPIDDALLQEYAQRGPFRFVSTLFLKSKAPAASRVE